MACSVSISNVSKSRVFKEYGFLNAIWFDQDSTGVTLANALLEATWTAKVNAASTSRMYVLNPDKPVDVTVNKEDRLIKRGNTGKRIKSREGEADLLIRYEGLSFCVIEKIKSLDSSTLYGYFITDKEAIIAGGTDTQLEPVECQIFVGEPTMGATSDDEWSLEVQVFIVPTEDYFKNAVFPNAQDSSPWKPTQLDGIIDVDIAVVSSDVSSQNVIMDITTQCDECEVTTFVTAGDFEIQLTSGEVARTITGISNVGNRYTLTVTDLTAAAHRIRRKAANLATDKGYETTEWVAFTPVA